MLEVEKLALPGGWKISGTHRDGEPFQIERLSSEGEIRVCYSGVTLDYGPNGALSYVTVMPLEFLRAQPIELLRQMPEELWKTIDFLVKTESEVISKIDLERGVVEIAVKRRSGETFEEYPFDVCNGRLIPVFFASEKGPIGAIGLQFERDEIGNRFIVGVGSPSEILWEAQTLWVDPTQLDRDTVDIDEVSRFLKGRI